MKSHKYVIIILVSVLSTLLLTHYITMQKHTEEITQQLESCQNDLIFAQQYLDEYVNNQNTENGEFCSGSYHTFLSHFFSFSAKLEQLCYMDSDLIHTFGVLTPEIDTAQMYAKADQDKYLPELLPMIKNLASEFPRLVSQYQQ